MIPEPISYADGTERPPSVFDAVERRAMVLSVVFFLCVAVVETVGTFAAIIVGICKSATGSNHDLIVRLALEYLWALMAMPAFFFAIIFIRPRRCPPIRAVVCEAIFVLAFAHCAFRYWLENRGVPSDFLLPVILAGFIGRFVGKRFSR